MPVALYHERKGKNQICWFSRNFFTFPTAISDTFLYIVMEKCHISPNITCENAKDVFSLTKKMGKFLLLAAHFFPKSDKKLLEQFSTYMLCCFKKYGNM